MPTRLGLRRPFRATFGALFVPAVLAACSLAGCSSTDDAAVDDVGPKVTSHFNATWKAGTVVLDAAEVASSLRNPLSHDGVYELERSADLERRLTAGTVVLFTGVNLVRVTDAEVSGDTLTVRTEPVALADAAEEAHLDFDMSDALPILAPPSEVVDGAPLAPQSASLGGTQSVGSSLKIGDFDVEYKFTRAPEQLSGEFSVSYEIERDSAVKSTIKVAGVGTMKPLRARGSIDVSGGRTTASSVAYDDIDIELELTSGFVASGSGLQLINLPANLRVPFNVGPIPMFVGVGMNIEVEAKMPVAGSTIIKVRCTAKGNAGAMFNGKETSPTGALKDISCSLVPQDFLGTYASFGAAVRVDFPKIMLGVGLVDPKSKDIVVGAEGYIAVKHEVVANVSVSLEAAGNFPVITGTCLKVDRGMGLFVGGDIHLLGLKFGGDKQLMGETADPFTRGTGTGCSEP